MTPRISSVRGSSSTRSASAPATSCPFPRSLRMRAGFEVTTCSAVPSGTRSSTTASRTAANRLVTRPTSSPVSRPWASNLGRLPCPSDVKVICDTSTPASSIRRRPRPQATSPSSRKAGTVEVVKSTRPPAFAWAIPSSKRAAFRLMCVGTNCVGGNLGLVEDAPDQRQAAAAVAHVDVDHAGLAGEEAAAPRLGRDARELVEGRLRRAVVRDRDFADADDLVNQQQVPLDAARERLHRHGVRAAVDEGGQPLLVEAARLGEECRQVSRDAVGAEAADDGRDAAADGVGEAQFGRARRVAAFAAAADHVDVAVDEARHGGQVRRVEDLAVALRRSGCAVRCGQSARRP